MRSFISFIHSFFLYRHQFNQSIMNEQDTCATNFMLRDKLMQRLVPAAKEPITPFLSSVRLIYEQLGTSVVMVVGSAGDYFAVADTVLMMDRYRPVDVTERAKVIAAEAQAAEAVAAAAAAAASGDAGDDSTGGGGEATRAAIATTTRAAAGGAPSSGGPTTAVGGFKRRQIDRGSFRRLAGSRCFARSMHTVALARDPLPDGTLDELDLGACVRWWRVLCVDDSCGCHGTTVSHKYNDNNTTTVHQCPHQ
jgi:hypothetical protein